MSAEIIPEKFKTLLCKNDDCLKVLAEIRRVEPQPGLVLRIKCHRCLQVSEWRFGYSEMQEQFDTIKQIVDTKGGEK